VLLCGGCAERLELELQLSPELACAQCGRHEELCGLAPCSAQIDTSVSTTRPDVVWVALADISPAHNSRRYYEPSSLEELTRSIRCHGMLQPLCVRPHGDRFVLIFGLRRFRAAVAAGLVEVPCMVLPADDQKALLINFSENLQRAALLGTERLRAIERLAANGLGVRELSRRTGFSPSTISRWLRVNRDPALREAVESGVLDIGQAKILVGAPKSALPALLQEAPGLTASQLRERVMSRKRTCPAPVISEAERHLSDALGALRAIRTHVESSDMLAELQAQVSRVRAL
jgi:ParB/RepB/Spo0J family partition protein